MTRLTDYSSLRKDGFITIPLNGETYEAIADPPAGVSLESVGAIDPDDLRAMASLIERSPDGVNLPGDATPAEMANAARAAAGGMQATRRVVRFFDQVLTPESLARWTENYLPADPEWPKTRKAKHEKARISMSQMQAVHQDLVKEYAKRPTTPPVSSPNGHGGTGGTSTAGAQAEA